MGCLYHRCNCSVYFLRPQIYDMTAHPWRQFFEASIRRAVSETVNSLATLFRTTDPSLGSRIRIFFNLSLHHTMINMQRGKCLTQVDWLEFLQGRVISQWGFTSLLFAKSERDEVRSLRLVIVLFSSSLNI